MKDFVDNSSLFDLLNIKNDNNDHLLCEIIQNLWQLQGNNNRDTETETETEEINFNNGSNSGGCGGDDELQALLYEIDMNLEYFRNDYQEFKHNDAYDLEDINIDKLLSFQFSHEACNMLAHESEISCKLRRNLNSNKQVQLADMFARVDNIPEFVPVNVNVFNEGGGGEEYCGDEDMMLFNMDDNNDEDIFVQDADIFDNVYNYTPDATLLYDDNLNCLVDDVVSASDQAANGEETTNGAGGVSSGTAHLNRQLLSAAYYLRKKIMDLDAASSSTASSSTASSLKDGSAGGKGGGGFMIPRLIKSTFRKPCVYMLSEGRCSRSDCRFAHDLCNITCRYWLEGECLKGDSCEFLHDFASESHDTSSSAHSTKSMTKRQLQQQQQQQQKAKDFNLNTMDFPELGGAPKVGKSTTTTTMTTTTTTTMTQNTEIELTESLISSSSSSGGDSSSSSSSTSGSNTKIDKIIDEQQPAQQQQQQQLSTSVNSNSSSSSSSTNKKSRKFKDKVLYSLTLPGFQLSSSRKKNIN